MSRMHVLSSVGARSVGLVRMREGGTGRFKPTIVKWGSWCFSAVRSWAGMANTFHLHAQYMPSYVKTVNVGHKEGDDQNWAVKLTIDETPQVVRRLVGQACDRQGRQTYEPQSAMRRGGISERTKVVGQGKEVDILLSTSWQSGTPLLPPLLNNVVIG